MGNPDDPEAHDLKGWYEMQGGNVETKTLTVKSAGGSAPRIFITQIKDDQIGMIDNKSEYFTIVGTVTYIKKDNCMYQACPSDSCNKKVIENGPQDYRCEKCQRSYQTFSWRLMVSMSIADATGQTWVTAFQDAAEKMLCVKADDLGNMKENDEGGFMKVLGDAQFSVWKLRCR